MVTMVTGRVSGYSGMAFQQKSIKPYKNSEKKKEKVIYIYIIYTCIVLIMYTN